MPVLHRRIAILLIVSMLASMGMARWFHVVTAHAGPHAGPSDAGGIIQADSHACSHAGCNPVPATPAEHHPADSDRDTDPEPADECDICNDLTRHIDAAPSLTGPIATPTLPVMVWRSEPVTRTTWGPARPVDARGPPIANG